MAAKITPTIETVTADRDGQPLTIGWNTARRTITARHTVSVEVIHFPLPRIYIQIGETYYAECGRCGNTGNYGSGPYGGICYNCNGAGICDAGLTLAEFNETIARWAERAAAESRATERRMAAIRAETAAWVAAHTDLVTWAKGLTPSAIETNVDSYITDAPTEDGAKVGRGWFQERMLWVHHYENDGRWGACFTYDEERFTQFGGKSEDLIRRVRFDSALDPRETAYLTKVMASKKEQAADPTAAASRHAGQIGERVTVSGTVVRATVKGQPGDEYMLVKVEGQGKDAGITLVTFSSGDAAWDRKEGELVTMTGTIKGRDEYQGVKSDKVNFARFTVITELPAAPAEKATPAKSASAPMATRKAASGTGRREALGASCVDGWELLYDKPRASAEVVRRDGKYALACKQHKTLHPLARLTDEGKVRKAGGWCTDCN